MSFSWEVVNKDSCIYNQLGICIKQRQYSKDSRRWGVCLLRRLSENVACEVNFRRIASKRRMRFHTTRSGASLVLTL
eukprot:5052039-Amphidinium_carterae.1